MHLMHIASAADVQSSILSRSLLEPIHCIPIQDLRWRSTACVVDGEDGSLMKVLG